MPKNETAQFLDLDKRILYKKLSAGEVDEKELQSALKKLPDAADNAEEISIEENEEK